MGIIIVDGDVDMGRFFMYLHRYRIGCVTSTSLLFPYADRDGLVDLPYKPFQAPGAHVAD